MLQEVIEGGLLLLQSGDLLDQFLFRELAKILIVLECLRVSLLALQALVLFNNAFEILDLGLKGDVGSVHFGGAEGLLLQFRRQLLNLLL